MRALLFTAIAIIFLVTLTTQVKAAEWEKIFEDDKTKISLDLSSVKKLPDNHYKIMNC